MLKPLHEPDNSVFFNQTINFRHPRESGDLSKFLMFLLKIFTPNHATANASALAQTRKIPSSKTSVHHSIKPLSFLLLPSIKIEKFLLFKCAEANRIKQYAMIVFADEPI